MHLIYISDSTIKLFTASHGDLELIAAHGLNEQNSLENLSACLTSYGVKAVTLVLDLGNEEFHYESLPHVRGKDKKLLVKRKLQKLYRNDDFANFKQTGRSRSGRKDDFYFFSGLTETSAVDSLLARLFDLKVAVDGIYSVPQLSPKLLGLVPHGKQVLLVSQETTNADGFVAVRLSFINKGKLHISRVSVSNSSNISHIAEMISRECERTARFLINSRTIERGSRLECLFALPPAILEAIDHNQDLSFLEYLSLEPKLLAKKTGWKKATTSVSLAEISCFYLSRHKSIRPHYSNSRSTLFHKLNLVRKGLITGSVVTGIAAVLFSTLNYQLILEIDKETKLTKQTIATKEALLTSFTRKESDEEISPVLMRSLVETQAGLKSHHSPEKLFTVISRAYEGYRDLSITTIEWHREAAPDINSHDSEDEMMSMNDEMDIDTEEISSISALQSITRFKITGKIDHFQGNYRESIDRITSFTNTLESHPEIKTAVAEKLPIDINPSVNLTRSNEDTSNAEFTILAEFQQGEIL